MPRTANAASCRTSASWLLAPPQTTRQRRPGMVASFSTAPSAAGANTSTCWVWISSGAATVALQVAAAEADLRGGAQSLEHAERSRGQGLLRGSRRPCGMTCHFPHDYQVRE